MALTNQTLRQYVGDMVALERHVHNAVTTFVQLPRKDADPAVLNILNTVQQMADTHVTALERHLGSLGGDVGSPIKKAVAAMSGAMEGVYSKIRGFEEAKLLRDLYFLLNVEAISYSMLYTTGLALKSSETADLALRHLHEVTPLVMRVAEMAPQVLVKELTRDYPWIEPGVAEEARSRTVEAWTVHAAEEVGR